MKLSIIIPLYNAEQYIDRCLQSILNSGVTDYEVICVDDGSTDNSLQIIKSYEGRYEHIHALTQKNSFAGIARNHGMRHAKGEYLHFMDVDDEVLPNVYNKIIQQMDELDVDLMKVKAISVDMQTQEETVNPGYMLTGIKEESFGRLLTREEAVPEFLKASPAPWTMIFRHSYVKDNGMQFDNLQCANDKSFFANIISHTNKMAISENILVRHYVNNKDSLVGMRRKTIACDVESCKFVKKVLEDVPAEIRNPILNTVMSDVISWYGRLGVQEKKQNKDILRSHLDSMDFRTIPIGTFWRALGEEADELFGGKWLDFVGYDYTISTEAELFDLLLKTDDVVVYGAGQVAETFLRYLTAFEIHFKKVSSIMVSDCKKNIDRLYGIPVVERTSKPEGRQVTIIIATFENVHRDILAGLKQAGYSDVFYLSEELYCNLKQ